MELTTSKFAEVENTLKLILPAMQADGGGYELLSIDGGVVQIRLIGACQNCPSKELTTKLGIERTLKEKLVWVTKVERIDP